MSETMPAGGADLERRLEEAECALYADLYAVLPADVARAHGVSLERRGAEHRFTAAAIDHPFFNRVMGIGIHPASGRALDGGWVEEHARHYEASGVRRFMLQVVPHVETAPLRDAMAARGMVRLRGWAKHLGPPAAGPQGRADLLAKPVEAGDVDAWVSLCAEGFGLTPRPVPPRAAVARRARSSRGASPMRATWDAGGCSRRPTSRSRTRRTRARAT